MPLPPAPVNSLGPTILLMASGVHRGGGDELVLSGVLCVLLAVTLVLVPLFTRERSFKFNVIALGLLILLTGFAIVIVLSRLEPVTPGKMVTIKEYVIPLERLLLFSLLLMLVLLFTVALFLDYPHKGEVQIANPNASGTAYTAIASLVQVMGEEDAYSYLKALHANVNQYPRSGVAPIKAAARGETGASISFIHDVVTEAQAGFPVKAVAPCEGTGYEIGSMSIVKGARNLENAKKFYDWALTPRAQALAAQAKQFQLPSNVASPVSPLSPKVADIKLINYDFAKYGSSAERKRLLERWDREVGAIAK